MNGALCGCAEQRGGRKSASNGPRLERGAVGSLRLEAGFRKADRALTLSGVWESSRGKKRKKNTIGDI